MFYIKLVVFSVLISVSWSADLLKFPQEFMFGAASAAYQVEGAWNVSGRSPSIWDWLVHTRNDLIADRSNGDVACDSYRLWRRDIEMCEELGLNMYRFSISWSRLLPTGFPNYVSEDAKNYYNNLINGLLEKGIQPLVTLHHFDLPQCLQDLGGWANPLAVDWFTDYAEVVFSLYADRVKYWLTINEPIVMCDGGYGEFAAPYIDDPKVGRYLCNKNALIAHAKAYRLYDEKYRAKYNGKLSISTLFFWFEPYTPEDREITDLLIEYWEGRYAYPIYSKKGGWPVKIEQFLADKAKLENYPFPRLAPFTPEEIELIRGTYDFYALNHYSTRMVRKLKPGETPGPWFLYGSEELGLNMGPNPNWTISPAADWFAMYPQGLRRQLQWLNTTYDVKEIIITENGIPTLPGDGLADAARIKYYRDNLEQILFAINEGINVAGYTAWTMMDNFEWLGGYTNKFGLYSVDFTDPNRTRTPRDSARFYAQVTRSRSIYPLKANVNTLPFE